MVSNSSCANRDSRGDSQICLQTAPSMVMGSFNSNNSWVICSRWRVGTP